MVFEPYFVRKVERKIGAINADLLTISVVCDNTSHNRDGFME